MRFFTTTVSPATQPADVHGVGGRASDDCCGGGSTGGDHRHDAVAVPVDGHCRGHVEGAAEQPARGGHVEGRPAVSPVAFDEQRDGQRPEPFAD